MKKSKIILPMAMVVALGFSSCQKEKNEDLSPQKTEIKDLHNLPIYSEANTKALNWEELPEELRNARPYAELQAKLAKEARGDNYEYAVGPFGGNGGGSFDCPAPAQYTKLHAIAIRSGARIDRIIVWYKHHGQVYFGFDAGGEGGGLYVHHFDKDEYIYDIHGLSGARLDHIRIQTNRKHLVFGGTGGSFYNVEVPNGYHINGFFGRSGAEIDQIGFYVSRL